MEKINEWLNSVDYESLMQELSEKLGVGVEFLHEAIQEYIWYWTGVWSIGIFVWFFIFLTCLVSVYLLDKFIKQDQYYKGVMWPATIVTGILSIITIWIPVEGTMYILKTFLAPKVQYLETIKYLIQN